MMNHESKRPVTLEEILRLKRAERPSAEFWSQFDRELRAKQLAALMQKRPWWTVVPRAFSRVSRYHLPLGATAVLALTIVSIHEFRPAAPVSAPARTVGSQGAALALASSVPAAVPIQAASASGMNASGAVEPAALAMSGGALARSENPADESDVDSPMAADSAAKTTAFETASVARKIMLGSRSIGSDLVAVHVPDLPGALRGFETRALSAHAKDPLAQMALPADSRPSRQLLRGAAMAVSMNLTPSTRSSNVNSARRLSDDQLHLDAISRIDARGNSLALKF